jgi:hypothetical protein
VLTRGLHPEHVTTLLGCSQKDPAVARDSLDALLPVLSQCGAREPYASELSQQLLDLLGGPVGKKAVPCVGTPPPLLMPLACPAARCFPVAVHIEA